MFARRGGGTQKEEKQRSPAVDRRGKKRMVGTHRKHFLQPGDAKGGKGQYPKKMKTGG